jgi:hypothetical protein
MNKITIKIINKNFSVSSEARFGALFSVMTQFNSVSPQEFHRRHFTQFKPHVQSG